MKIPTLNKQSEVVEIEEVPIEKDPYYIKFNSSKYHSIPAHWEVERNLENPEIVYARNNVTGLIFEGEISEFNFLLRS